MEIHLLLCWLIICTTLGGIVEGAVTQSLVYANHSGTTTSAPNSDTKTSHGLGGYVAHGIGINASITGSENLTTTIVTAYTTTFIADQISTYTISEDDVTSLSASNNISATMTPAPSTKTGNQTSLTGAAAVCQESWNTYWSLLGEYSMGGVYGTKTSIWNVSARVTTYTDESDTILSTTPHYVVGSDVLSTWTTLLTFERSSTFFTEVGTVPGYVIRTTLYTSSAISSPTPPSCSPPIDASACASSWSQYSSSLGQFAWWQPGPGDGGTLVGACSVDPAKCNLVPTITATSPPPECYNPPVNISYCSSLAAEYRTIAGINDLANAEVYHEGGYEGPYNPGISLAPGCTLGCDICTMSALNFQLLYWGTQASNITPSVLVTAVIGDSTTLTSPQVYLSFAQLGASDSCGQVGNTIKSGVVAIDTARLSNIERLDLGLGKIMTKRFLALGGDAVIPVTKPLPFSEFLSWQANNVTTFHLLVPPEIKALNPSWSGCGEVSFGIPEPPSVLSPATVTVPMAPKTTPAPTPAASLTSPAASNTQMAITPAKVTGLDGSTLSAWLDIDPSSNQPQANTQTPSTLITTIISVSPIVSGSEASTPQVLSVSIESSESRGEESVSPTSSADAGIASLIMGIFGTRSTRTQTGQTEGSGTTDAGSQSSVGPNSGNNNDGSGSSPSSEVENGNSVAATDTEPGNPAATNAGSVTDQGPGASTTPDSSLGSGSASGAQSVNPGSEAEPAAPATSVQISAPGAQNFGPTRQIPGISTTSDSSVDSGSANGAQSANPGSDDESPAPATPVQTSAPGAQSPSSAQETPGPSQINPNAPPGASNAPPDASNAPVDTSKASPNPQATAVVVINSQTLTITQFPASPSTPEPSTAISVALTSPSSPASSPAALTPGPLILPSTTLHYGDVLTTNSQILSYGSGGLQIASQPLSGTPSFYSTIQFSSASASVATPQANPSATLSSDVSIAALHTTPSVTLGSDGQVSSQTSSTSGQAGQIKAGGGDAAGGGGHAGGGGEAGGGESSAEDSSGDGESGTGAGSTGSGGGGLAASGGDRLAGRSLSFLLMLGVVVGVYL